MGQELLMHYYILPWAVIFGKYRIEFNFSRACRLETYYYAINISDIFGLGNIVRWEGIKDNYIYAHCFAIKLYLSYVTIAARPPTKGYPETYHCERCWHKISLTSTHSSGLYDIEINHAPKGACEEYSTIKTDVGIILTKSYRCHGMPSSYRKMTALSWNEATSICRHRETEESLQFDMFTYVSVSELKDVTDKLEKSGILDGRSRVIFIGFTGRSVRFSYNI